MYTNALLSSLPSKADSVVLHAIVLEPGSDDLHDYLVAFSYPGHRVAHLMVPISEAFVFTVIHHSLEVTFKSVLSCGCFFFPFVIHLQTRSSECGESQVVYIVNGKAAEFSGVKQSEEKYLFLNEESQAKSDCRWLLIVRMYIVCVNIL